MVMAQNAEDRRKGKHVDEKSAKDYFEEDQAFFSDAATSAQGLTPTVAQPVDNLNIQLSDIRKVGVDAQNVAIPVAQMAVVQEGFKIEASQSVEIQLELRFQENKPVEGLVVHDKNFAESDRYLFNFRDGSTFTILDKWTNKSTTIWGDPHVDVDDVEGTSNGDFKDLKGSQDHTTFLLSDGTRVTFKAQDSGLIEKVDIIKGSQHVLGIGQEDKSFSATNGLFSTKVMNDGSRAAVSIQMGDVVHSGGDGNDWFDNSNKLVWGKTTGPIVTQRPSAVLEFSYKQTVTQSLSIQAISRTA